jgi:hypothetical protein
MTDWTDALLDPMRRQGDKLADDVIAGLVKDNDTGPVSKLLETLMSDSRDNPKELPGFVDDYLASSGEPLNRADRARIGRAQELFQVNGPEILLVLGVYSLPEAYASHRGVKVLHRTGFLENRPMRRVWETTQFLVDVLRERGLEAKGHGLRTAQKVRLMHAAIRRLIRVHSDWDEAKLGVPINQEDLAGTLMTFSVVVLEGLRRLGIRIPRSHQDDYFYTWRVMGEVMGVQPELIPENLEDGLALAKVIAGRQMGESTEGQAMAKALVDGLECLVGVRIGLIPTAMRFFLEQDSISGKNVAEYLALPASNWTRWLLVLMGLTTEVQEELAGSSRFFAKAISRLRMRYVDGLLRSQLPGRPSFDIPETLHGGWRARRHKLGETQPG